MHYHSELRSKINQAISKQMIDTQENRYFHNPLSLERLLVAGIRNGDMSVFLKYVENYGKDTENNESLGILSLDNLRQARYIFVTSAAIFSRAAIDGGLNRETACGMADVYCRQMDELETKDMIELLQAQMLLHFCDAVRSAKSMDKYSKITQDACHYIESHLHENIRIPAICSYVGISANRLTEHFRRDTGLSPMEFVHTKKLEEAAHLLRYSNYTYSEISNLLAYSNQSYFIVKFKKNTV